MRGTLRILAFFSLLLATAAGFGQGISNKGREFWVGYGHHQFMEPGQNNSQEMTLYLSAEENAATVTVTIDSSGPFPTTWWRRTFNIPAFTVISIEDVNAISYSSSAGAKGPIPKGAPGQGYDARLITDAPPAGTGGAGLFRKKGIRIQSNVPIVAYAHIYGSASSGATTLIPVEAWGYEYISINNRQSYDDNCYSWMYVVASRDSTIIDITPSVVTRAQNLTGLRPNQTKRVMLMKGQIYQVIGANDGANADGNGGTLSTGRELTGTRVRSVALPGGDCYPIAVFSGSSRTSNPATCGSGGGDNDNYQMYPMHAWGRRYLTAPYSTSNSAVPSAPSRFKVAVKDPTTVVRRNNQVLTGLQNGNYYVYESSTADYLEADKPITVVQTITGGTGCGMGSDGDPDMVALSPIEQGIKQVGFYRNDRENIDINYLTLIVPTPGVASLRVDNSAAFDYTGAHPNLAGYSIVVKRWNAARAQVLVKCDSAFTAITYGLGSVESYSYSAGAFFNNLNAVSDLHNLPDTSNQGKNSHLYTCVNTPIKLSVLMRYKPLTLQWHLDSLCAVMTPCASVMMNPASTYYTDSVNVKGIGYYRYTLPGTYSFSRAGLHDIRITSTSLTLDNCNNKEELTITVDVKPRPTINFSITHPTRCNKDTVYFGGPNASGNGYDIARWEWTFDSTRIDSVQNPKHLFDTGTHRARLYIATEHGCAADTTIRFNVVPPPKATFGVTPPAVCLGQAITFTDTSSYTGPVPRNRWYWDFGNGTIIDTTNGNSHTITYDSARTYTVKHVVAVSPLCVSDTAVKLVPVYPGAVLGFTYPIGCLPSTGIAQFGADSVDVGGQKITSYLWNFGDSNATAANPNTSTAQNPTHTYSAFGSYTVTLSVVTASGCTGDTSVTISMNVQPTTTFGALDSVCANSPLVSVAKGSVTNAVPGRGRYYGPGTDTLGNFNPAVAGEGLHEILYVYNSQGGCIDTARSSITVNPVPAKPIVISPVNYCQNSTDTALAATATAGNTLMWFNNPQLTGGVATAPVPPTTVADTLIYYVRQHSQFGCVGDTAQINVIITPSITGNTISANQTLCSSGASADTLRSSATVSGGDGNYAYQWQISSDGGTTWTDIAGATSAAYFPGAINGERMFRRNVTSGLCASTSNTITVNIIAGFTNFDITGNQPLCAGSVPTIIDGQTAQGGGTISYQWQSSADSTTWTDIAGANAEDFQPAALTSTIFYRRLVRNSVCTATSSVVKVTVNAVANGAITGPISICAYDTASVVFNATAGVAPFTVQLVVTNPAGVPTNITRTFATAGPASIQVIAANSPAGLYTINIASLTDSNQCARTTGFTPVAIDVLPKPALTISADTALCSGDSVMLTATGANIFSWWPASGLSTTNSGQVVARPTVTTTYWVNGSTNGCSADSVDVTVTVNPVPAKPIVPAAVVYCQNEVAIALSATAATGNTLTWYSNPALTGGSSTVPVPSTASAGTFRYFVTQTNNTSCESDTATITVTVQPSIAGNTISADQTLCSAGTAAPINTNGSVTGGTGSYTYQWQQSVDGGTTWADIAGATSESYNPGNLTSTTTYRRNAVSGECTNTSNQVTITVLAPFTGTGISGTQQVCSGEIPNLLNGETASAGTAQVFYQWQSSANGTTWSDITGASDEDYLPSALTTTTHYRRRVYNSTCSTLSSPVIVTVNQLPNGNITTTPSICVYDQGSVSFTVSQGVAPYSVVIRVTNPSGAASFVSSTVSNNSPITIDVLPANSADGIYNITIDSITDANGCVRNSGFATLAVTVHPKPVLTVSPGAVICGGDTAHLSVSGATNYAWSPSAGLNGISGGFVIAQPVATTTYSVVGTANGCVSDTATVDVTVNPVPAKPTVIRPVIYCEKDTAVALSATAAAGNSLTWYANSSLTGGSATAPTPFTSTVGTAVYYVTQTTPQACTSDTSRIAVMVNPLPTPAFLLPGPTCINNGQATVQFTNQTSVSGGGNYTSLWYFGDGNTSTDRNPIHTYSSPGPHQVRLVVTTASGCVRELEQTLPQFLEKPVANFSVTPDSLCQGAPSSFTDLSTAQGSTITSWNWSFGDGTTSTLPSPVRTYPLPGIYTVRLSVVNAAGCQNDTTQTVSVYLQPELDAGPSFVVPQGSVVQLVPFVKDSTNLTYEWTPGFLVSNPNELRPTVQVQNDEVLMLTATGLGQCTASDTVSVKALLPVNIPNAFSPNGDGINDTWQIPYLVDYPGCTVEIFNRYGQSVYRSVGYNQPWDGRLNGNPLPVGVYYYIIELKNGFNQLTGSVTILK